MKNRRNIVEQQNPPQNPNDIWLKDGKFYRSTSEGWTIIDSELEYTNKETMIADNPKGGTIGIDKESGEPSIYNDVTKQWSPLSGGVTETTWQELKDKRDTGKLIPGALYRITDYQCTTTQVNTRSAGHQFDIVLLALSKKKLAEEGWAMMHESNIYDVTFKDGVTKKCYLYFFDDDTDCNIVLAEDPTKGANLGIGSEDFPKIDKINKTAELGWSYYGDEHGDGFITIAEPNVSYNYFQNSNLSAWKVWYCLDNDTDRFAWADDSVDEDVEENIKINGGTTSYFRYSAGDTIYENTKLYAWKSLDDIIRYSKIEEIESGILVYQFLVQGLDSAGSITSYTPYHKGTGPNGRGVIYRMIDEHNNDCPYDFKNIQFKRTITNGQYDANGTETWCYTLNLWYNDMCQDASIVGNTLPNDEGFITGVYDNIFGDATAYDVYIEGVNTFAFALGNNVILSFDNSSVYYGICCNTIGNAFCNNTIGNGFTSNSIGNNFENNTIGNIFANNMIGNNFSNKTISDHTKDKNYGNNGVELATKNDIGDIETALNNI